jgi:hypothetical protein
VLHREAHESGDNGQPCGEGGAPPRAPASTCCPPSLHLAHPVLRLGRDFVSGARRAGGDSCLRAAAEGTREQPSLPPRADHVCPAAPARVLDDDHAVAPAQVRDHGAARCVADRGLIPADPANGRAGVADRAKRAAECRSPVAASSGSDRFRSGRLHERERARRQQDASGHAQPRVGLSPRSRCHRYERPSRGGHPPRRLLHCLRGRRIRLYFELRTYNRRSSE